MTEPKRGPGRPATGQKPNRSVRVGPVWDAAKARAKRRGDKFADVVESLLAEYVERG